MILISNISARQSFSARHFQLFLMKLKVKGCEYFLKRCAFCSTPCKLCIVRVNWTQWQCRGLAWEWFVSAGRPVLYFCHCATHHVAVSPQPFAPPNTQLLLSSALHLCHYFSHPYCSNLSLVFILSFVYLLLAEDWDNMENYHTFLYFAYGSNLLKERLQLKNPSATVHCVARLKVQTIFIIITGVLFHTHKTFSFSGL